MCSPIVILFSSFCLLTLVNSELKHTSPDDVLSKEQADLAMKELSRLSTGIDKVKDQLKELQLANLNHSKVLSAQTADAELQRLEAVLKIGPRFRQMTGAKHTRSLRRHLHTRGRKDDNDHPEDEIEEEKEGEEEAEEYVKAKSGPPSSEDVEDPEEFVARAANGILKTANDAASIATGIPDYLGVDSREEKLRAEAQAKLTLADGFGPIVGSYVSGETPETVKAQEETAAKHHKEPPGENKPHPEEKKPAEKKE